MHDWIERLYRLSSEHKKDSILVTIADVKGSAPREAGARMIVTEDELISTIGGGNLEFTSIEQARTMLRDRNAIPLLLQQIALGPNLEQCCGGRVKVAFEKITKADRRWIDDVRSCYQSNRPSVLVTGYGESKFKKLMPLDSNNFGDESLPRISEAIASILDREESLVLVEPKSKEEDQIPYTVDEIRNITKQLWLFGAGHVGRAIASVMQDLPYQITWIDSRQEEFTDAVHSNVKKVVSTTPQLEVSKAPKHTLFLVLTHSHRLDEDICHEVLRRGDFGFLGLIGSDTKKALFLHRLRDRGIPDSQLCRMTCPIGIESIQGRAPGEIAVSVAAQLLSMDIVVDGYQVDVDDESSTYASMVS